MLMAACRLLALLLLAVALIVALVALGYEVRQIHNMIRSKKGIKNNDRNRKFKSLN